MVEQFLKDLFGDEKINFLCIRHDNSWAVKVQGKYEEVQERLRRHNVKLKYDIYFVPNSGGYKNEKITKLNACFIDLDAGKDEDGNYLPLHLVEEYKQRKFEQIHNFPLSPSYTIETRNGFHVYWLLKDDPWLADWIKCQEKLIDHFQSDPRIKNPARLMRCPGFYWMKNQEEKFMCNIIEKNNVKYTLDEILTVFKGKNKNVHNRSNISIERHTKNSDPKRGNDTNVNNINIIPPNYRSIFNMNDNIKMIVGMDILNLKQIINAKPVTFNSHYDVYDYLKKQDLSLLLGVNGKSFNCLFHDDEHPSAGIIQNEETGHYIYNCFACNWKGTIFQVTERLTGLNKPKTLEFLMNVYNITLEESKWQQEQKAILEENMRFLMSREFQELYPELYSRVKRYIHELYTINGIARDFIVSGNWTDRDGDPIFYSSIINLTKMCHVTSVDKMCNRIALFTWLEMMKKLSDKEIPEFLLEISKKHQEEKKQNQRISYYSIPSYTDYVLKRAEEKAQEWKARGMTMKGLSREMLLRASGEQEADRVYPQMAGKPIPKRNEQKSRTIEKVCCELIEKKGFTTEREIVQKIRRNKKRTEEQLKKILPELLDKYGLKREWANRELRDKFKLPQGFRGIIIYKDK
ncbi:hypothetical protein [Desulfofundulus thermocisternus]|uniref:hypothetical protein n=1 Tax=Desulfofundulus thermocisternus TaxID=42471 RepID=UPI00217D2C65|nr:hypothetical protein [Desulfofundulus thermocisternus]MCS5695260.1 hypothetical protein [Desulfofundulus thermocisternus]